MGSARSAPIGCELSPDSGECALHHGAMLNELRRHSEAVGELCRCEPFVVIRGRAILLLSQQVIKVGLLGGGRPESQRYPVQYLATVGEAKIETRLGKAMHVAGERHHLAGIDRCGDAVGLLGETQS